MNTRAYTNFSVTTDERGVTFVTLDVPGRPLNVLDHDVMSELDQIVHDLENTADTKLVVFRSGKESGFLAGADVHAIASIESASAAGRLIEQGQLLFQRIEWLPMPTVAVLHGPCLGGGLEWALSCRYRIARDNSSTQIGLPEIKLGLIPGWGGTQRLPKRVGLSNALPMILSGKSLDAREALKIGLVDASISPPEWESGVESFITAVFEGRSPGSRRSISLWRRLLDETSLGRAITLHAAAAKVKSKVKNYPALASALKVIRLAFKASPDGFIGEREEFCELLATSTCRNLLSLFFARDRARNLATWSAGKNNAWHDAPVQSVGVVGAGAMGAGIGALAARRGFDVVLKELDEDQVRAGRQRIEKLIDGAATRKGWPAEQRSGVLDRITVTAEADAFVNSDLVIEAVVEREDVKRDVFAVLDRVTPKHAILASNTSSLSVTRMGEATTRVSKVAGLHFFNPVHRMELVEVVRAEHTDQQTIARLVGFVRALGKTPIVTSDSPGFLVNRVLFPYLGEAVLTVRESGDVAGIDRQIRKFGMPMGPLELLDQVGLDVALHVAKSLESVLPGVAAVVDSLATHVDAGRLGKKSSIGFYHYTKGKRDKPVDLSSSLSESTSSDRDQTFADDGLTRIQRRLVYPMLAESIRCLDERVVEEAWAVDMAMVLGTGFAPHLGGPLHLIDAIGHDVFVDNLSRLKMVFGDRYAAPEKFQPSAAAASKFFEAGTSEHHVAASS